MNILHWNSGQFSVHKSIFPFSKFFQIELSNFKFNFHRRYHYYSFKGLGQVTCSGLKIALQKSLMDVLGSLSRRWVKFNPPASLKTNERILAVQFLAIKEHGREGIHIQEYYLDKRRRNRINSEIFWRNGASKVQSYTNTSKSTMTPRIIKNHVRQLVIFSLVA